MLWPYIHPYEVVAGTGTLFFVLVTAISTLAVCYVDAASKLHIQPECEERAGWRGTGTAELVSRDQILRREGGKGKRSADHEQDWQPYLVDP